MIFDGFILYWSGLQSSLFSWFWASGHLHHFFDDFFDNHFHDLEQVHFHHFLICFGKRYSLGMKIRLLKLICFHWCHNHYPVIVTLSILCQQRNLQNRSDIFYFHVFISNVTPTLVYIFKIICFRRHFPTPTLGTTDHPHATVSSSYITLTSFLSPHAHREAFVCVCVCRITTQLP